MPIKPKKKETKTVGNVKISTFKISDKKAGFISTDILKQYAREFERIAKKKHGDDVKIVVRGSSILNQFTTFKGLDEDLDEAFQGEDDYLDGRVKETAKFSKLFYGEILLYRGLK